ncbi:MAG TPA: hypothetical protein VMT51_05000 [Dongiaceae bacterium]|nr:hypothetical protein [Dongiaceae bacterium]
MRFLAKLGAAKKMLLATALMGGFLAFFGASNAAAGPRVFFGVGIGGPVVARGYYAPPPPPPYYYRPAYPVYGYYAGPRYYHRYWDARYRCWRYYR